MKNYKESIIEHRTASGLILEGTLGIVEKPQGNILMSHGLDADRDESGFYTDIALNSYSLNYNVLRFDLRGHGKSQGILKDITITDLIIDVSGLIQYLHKINSLNITIISASFSGGVGLLAAQKNKKIIQSVILLNPVLDYYFQYIKKKDFWINEKIDSKTNKILDQEGYILHGAFPMGRKFIEDIPHYDDKNIPTNTTFPVLTIHGDKDKKVPYEIAYKNKDYNSYSEFYTIIDSDHGFRNPTNQRPEVLEIINKWLLKQNGR